MLSMEQLRREDDAFMLRVVNISNVRQIFVENFPAG